MQPCLFKFVNENISKNKVKKLFDWYIWYLHNFDKVKYEQIGNNMTKQYVKCEFYISTSVNNWI